MRADEALFKNDIVLLELPNTDDGPWIGIVEGFYNDEQLHYLVMLTVYEHTQKKYITSLSYDKKCLTFIGSLNELEGVEVPF